MPNKTWTFAIANADTIMRFTSGGSTALYAELRLSAYSSDVAVYVVMA